MDVIIVLFFIIINLGCVFSELSLRFVFIIEQADLEVTSQIGETIKKLEEKYPGVTIDDSIVDLDRAEEEESFRKLCSASTNITMLIDLAWSSWEKAMDIANTTQTPYVKGRLGIQQVLTGFNQYLDYQNATDVALIFQSEKESEEALYHLLGNSNVRIWVHAGMDDVAVSILKAMRPEPNFFAIIGDRGFVTNGYNRVVKEKLVKRKYKWNLVLTDYSDPNLGLMYPVATTIMTKNQNECCKMIGQNQCSCPHDFQYKNRVLAIMLKYLTDAIISLNDVKSTLATLDCDQILPSGLEDLNKKMIEKFDKDSSNDDSLFYWDSQRSGIFPRTTIDMYRTKKDLEQVASWKVSAGEFQMLDNVELEPMKLFFRVGTTASVPWTTPKIDPVTHKQMLDDEGNPLFEGYCIDLIEKLAAVIPFDYEIVIPKNGTFGIKQADGSWDGVVGDLLTGETDIAIAALTMTAEREEVIDFVAPYFEQTGIIIVIRKPTRKTSLFKFMTVLRTEVWFSIVGALILTGFMIWLLDKYSPYSAQNNKEAYPYPCREFTLKESFWFALTSFTPQGGGEAPKALSGRTLVAAYWLFVVLMLATFTANLAAFLTVERMQTPVSSLEQLARQSRINYTVVEGSSTHQYFMNMKFAEDTLYRVWKEITLNATSDQAQYRVWDYPIREQYGHILLAINSSGPVPDAKTGFQKVDEHTEADFAFIHDSAEIKYQITKNCNLTEVGEVFAEKPYAIAVQQGSRLQEDLSRALLDLQKERFLEQLGAKYWNESAKQACPDADESEGITLESLGGVFIATLFGLGLAMLTLAWEVFYYKRKEKNKIANIDTKVEIPKKTKPWKQGLAKVRKRKIGNIVRNVTIGDSFKPVSEKNKLSYINVLPKDGFYH